MEARLAPGFIWVGRLSAFRRNALRNTSILRDPLHYDPAVEAGCSHVRSTDIPLDRLSAVTARDHNLQHLHRSLPSLTFDEPRRGLAAGRGYDYTAIELYLCDIWATQDINHKFRRRILLSTRNTALHLRSSAEPGKGFCLGGDAAEFAEAAVRRCQKRPARLHYPWPRATK